MSSLRLGIRSRLFLIGLIAALPALLLVYGIALDQHREARARIEAEAMTAVRQVARAQDRAIVRTRELLQLLADLPQMRSGDVDVCHRLLARVLNNSEYYANIGVVDASGMLRCSALPFDSATNLTDRFYVRHAMETRDFTIGVYQIGRVTGQATVNLAYPIEADGRLVGVVFAALDLTWLQEVFVDADLPAGATLTLVDRNDTVLGQFPGRGQRLGETALEAARLREAQQRNQEATLELEVDTGTRIYAYSTLKTHSDADGGLLLYASVPPSQLQAAADRFAHQVLLSLLTAVALILTATFLAGRPLVIRPVRHLLQTVRRLGRGELGVRSQLPDNGGELAELAHAVDHMAANLQRQSTSLTRQAEQSHRLNRIYALLSSTNALIIRRHESEDLLKEVCNLAISIGGFPLVWIALTRPGSQIIERSWHAGADDRTRELLVPRSGVSPGRKGILHPVLHHGKTRVYRHPAADPLWPQSARDKLRLRGIQACALFPLRQDDAVNGCLGVYAEDEHQLDDAEVHLLEQLAADISLALTLAEQSAQLDFLAYRDPVTRLPNRQIFVDRTEQALQLLQSGTARPCVAVLAVGLKGLRWINSARGTGIGDEVLRQAARRITAVLTSATVARLHNSQFAVLLPGLSSPDAAADYADRLLEAFRAPLLDEEPALHLELRIGISVAPDDTMEATTLLQHAQTALTGLREQNTSYQFFTADLQHRAVRRLRIEHSLREAIAGNQFHLLYQPIVNLKTRRLQGVEALIRWHHPEMGDLSPGEFVPIAESTGLIAPIGEWVVSHACRQAKRWQEGGLPQFEVAVNVSVSQLRERRFLNALDKVIADCGVNPERLHLGLEITESELMGNVESAIERLALLHDKGFTLSIDDFGTGYSSLAYLKRFPVNTLKIDVAFVRDIDNDLASRAILEAVIKLANALGLNTVAEGVERAEQYELLEQLGCTAAQGHLFSPPVAAEAIPALAHRPIPVPPSSTGSDSQGAY